MTAPRSRTTVIIGGGITGLSAAHRLAQLAPDRVIIVCEAAPRFGGKLYGVDLTIPELADGGPGLRVDVGAESMLARRPEGTELITELGLDDQRVEPTPARAQAFLDGAVRPLPASNMGVPVDLDALDGYLSPDGVARARSEVDLPAEPLTGDVGIGRYVAERFGDEVTDRLVEPMLGGVYAGQSRRLSFEAVHPALYAAARSGGSLLLAAQQVAATARRNNDSAVGSAPPVFAGLRGGINTMIDALADDLVGRGVQLRPSTTVRAITATGGGYELITGPVPAPRVITADQVVLATPAAPAARLVSGLSDRAGRILTGIPYASMAVITFVLADVELHGSGLLVPPGELPTIKAFTYSSNKWQWIAEHAVRAYGEGVAVVRASVGRLGEEQLLQVDNDQLIERTITEARQVPGWESARPLVSAVQRWGGGLPQYLVDHRRSVAELRAAVDEVPGIAIAGAYLDGVGVPACIATGRQAVEKLLS